MSYKSIILVKYTNHEVDSNNILAAKPISKGSILYDFEGETVDELQKKVNSFINKIGELHAKETS